MILQPNGFNHVAICTLDMRKTLLYFNDTLGLPLAALYWMHGVKGTVHGFLTINDSSLLGFVFHPSVDPKIQVGKTHPGTMDGTSSIGTMHHLSFSVESMGDLANLRDRLSAKGIACTTPKSDSRSIEFAGPEGMLLKVSCKQDVDEDDLWDNDAALAVGLDEETLEKLKHPKTYARPSSPVKNTPFGKDAGFRMNYPHHAYRAMLSISDKTMLALTRDSLPPNMPVPFRFRLQKVTAKLTVLSHMIYHKIFNSRKTL